ncbi:MULTISPECIES: hypothetical protein [unclassified Mycobacterium]|uniref:hypothetical protein n=1 Tax=unclassified Mycobacterium TaxID=2642494 RepID=UPI00049002B0|nr:MULTISPECIES: hypothetical protein [unclassified Mycobacterium]SEA26275.1 hypothetical protein SAMN04488580_102193 [Mycobacterium sp. 283mftsu]
MTTDAATRLGQPGARTLSTGFGVLMVAVAGIQAQGMAVIVAVAALAAVGTGLAFRAAATGAVLLTVVVLALSDSPALVAALSGLSAAAYLLLRHAAGAGAVTMTRPTLLGMFGFTLMGVVATAVNLDLPWLPLLAPPAVVALYWLALAPHTESNRRNRVSDLNTVAP